MLQHVTQGNSASMILLSFSIILFSGFLLTRVTKLLHLPNVTGYIIAGVLIGPSVLGLIPQSLIRHLDFFSDMALSFIAFEVGRNFRLESFRRTGPRLLVISAAECLLSAVLVTLAARLIFRMPVEFCLLLGALATATAPASTMMTIRQYKAHGPFVNALLQITAFDDVICLLLYNTAIAIVNARHHDAGLNWHEILVPLGLNAAMIALGWLSGILLSRLINAKRSRDNRLSLSIALLFALAGICALFEISPLLSCLVFGMVYINRTDDDRVFKQISRFSSPIMTCFFIVSGMNLPLDVLKTSGVVGVVYFLVRIAGKYSGTYITAKLMRCEPRVSRYLGFALFPQAGVAIGLAFLGRRALPQPTGEFLLTIILSASVLYELVGPAFAKFALLRAADFPKPDEDAAPAP